MQACIGLSRADTHTGALEWFDVPIADLPQWIEAIEYLEKRQKKRREDSALCIYYADQQESVWDIAKKYNSSVAAVMEENGLDHDILSQRTMLLIPMF